MDTKSFYRKYAKKHKYCPKCGERYSSSTLVGYALDINNPDKYEDLNQCTCLSCGDNHVVHDRVGKKRAKILKLYIKTLDIYHSERSWEDKYDQIFSKKISSKIYKLIDLDYYDPDTSYEEDVNAFTLAFSNYIKDNS